MIRGTTFWSLGALLTAVLPQLVACSGESLSTEQSEPVRVKSGQFREGELPGKPPLTAEERKAGKTPEKPYITSVETSRRILFWNEAGHNFSGRTSTDAFSVAIGFRDLGDGYWILPAGNPDPNNKDELSFRATADFGEPLTPGLHQLVFAAIDEEGRSGNQSEVELCISSPIPDNLNVCIPSKKPPETVVSLAWEANVDLDLQIVTPEGKVVDAKHPTTTLEDEDGKIDPIAERTGRFDVDANRDCQGTGLYRENIVWNEKPKAGRYRIYANLYDACGSSSAAFTATIHTPKKGKEPDTFEQQTAFDKSGVVLAASANGGTGRGLLVGDFTVK